jgi:hypothetical protein
MSVVLAAKIRLAPDVRNARGSGWRCTCRFDEIVSLDGERLIGVEITREGGDAVVPDQDTAVALRLWAPLARLPKEGVAVEFFEGAHRVASGDITGLIDAAG